MKSDSITIKDIAKALNLSLSTVSRALKDSYKISEPIRKKVQEYAAAHRYKPNLVAQSLKNRKSRSIGVLIPTIPNSFFAEVISGIESVALETDYTVIITQSFESFEREIKNVEHMSGHAIDGLIVSISTETTTLDHFNQLVENGMPVVFFDRIGNLSNTHSVTVDNKEAVRKAIAHLIECGYKRIGHITSSPGLFITLERLAGYQQALDEAGIPFNESYIQYCMHGGMHQEEIDKAIQELFAQKNPPDALFTASDRITIGSLAALHRKGVNIPEQLAVAGFSNFSAPELLNASLITVKQPAFEMGKTAIELLLKTIESKRPVKTFEHKVLSAELITRAPVKK